MKAMTYEGVEYLGVFCSCLSAGEVFLHTYRWDLR